MGCCCAGALRTLRNNPAMAEMYRQTKRFVGSVETELPGI